MNFFNKKIKLLAITIVFVFISVFGSLFLFTNSMAAGAPVVVELQSPNMEAWLVREGIGEVKLKLKEKAILVAIGALSNGLNYFSNKIAYDMGVWLASGDWGQGPFASQKSFRDYLSQAAADSLGEIIGSMGDMLGMDLCNLPDLRLQLALQIGFHFGVEPPKPRCTWQELREAYNIDNIRSQYFSQEGMMNRIQGGIAVSDTDFGIWFKAKEKVNNYAAEQEGGKSLDRQEGDGSSPMKDIISGKIQVPAVVMSDSYIQQSALNERDKKEQTEVAMMGNALRAGGVQLAVNTAATFINTFLGTALQNFITKGMLPGGKVVCNPGMSISGLGWNLCLDEESVADQYYSAGSAGGAGQRRVAQEMFSELLMPKIRTIENYDPTVNLAECSPENLAPDSCVIDQSFLNAIQRGNFEQPLTIKQAIEQGFLHGDWKLYSSGNEAMNQKFDCANEAYCNRNLRMLRLLRILPLGLEIASQFSPVGNEKTLKEVVDGYYDELSDFYHLVNPYWIIKFPKTKCGSFAYSAVNYTDSPIRLQYCADIQHCVGYNTDGSCANWGYCLREKPIWNFNADYCDAENNTCLTFTSADRTTASYLLRTLDTLSCNEENDGCRRYSQIKYYDTATNTDWFPAISEFQANGLFFNTSLYFNNQAPTCDSSADGCSAFKLASNPNTLIYLKKAPDYLGCYDADGSTGDNKMEILNKKIKNGIQWPLNFADLNLINPQNKDECLKYAQVCLPEEENCNFYTSVLSQEVIPGKFKPAVISGGIVTWNDQCDAKCVGYDAYREMPSNYTNGELISYIIPSSGKTCSAGEAGCTSFTNLTATVGGLEQNEYFSYLRLCILPDQNLQRNYTVYERSETKGYEIKTFTLVKSDDSMSPKQIYRDGVEMTKYTAPNNNYCSELSYNAKNAEPDCHQFIDEFGNAHYAMLSKTVIVSEQCTPYRLNNTELISYGAEGRCPYDFDNGSNNQNGEPTVEFRDNACHYMGFTGNTNGAGDTVSCSDSVNSCRAYKGNAGYNVRKLVEDDFEDATTTNWSAQNPVSIAISTESTQLAGHSLRVSANTTSITDSSASRNKIALKKGKSYVLSFWAKGNLPLDQIGLSGLGDSSIFSNAMTVSDVWRYYSFGPIEYNGEDTAEGKINFYVGNSQGQLRMNYIDNVILTEVEDYIYLVKDSLRVDPICDSNPNDNLPGEALGCSAYIDPINTTFYLTNFNYLCREAAVGCTALIDTYNTPEDAGSSAYNVWLELKNPGQGGITAKATIDGIVYECAVPVAEKGCYVDIFGKTTAQINNGGIDSDNAVSRLVDSTIFIPADTSSDSPIYLVANKEATCKSENMGCQVIGLATKSVSGKSFAFNFLGIPTPLFTDYETFEEVVIKNDQALYETMSCVSEAEGCKSWVSGQSKYYFKDPVTSSGLICEYKKEPFTAILLPVTNQSVPTSTSNLPDPEFNSTGWVWKDVGICVLESANLYMGRACATDNDCLIGTSQGKCLAKNKLPCYPKYRSYSGEYGLWSYGTEDKYNGFVGLCPENQSGCNEFIDPSSSEDNKKCSISGKKCNVDSDCEVETDGYCIVNTQNAYYLIENTKLSTAQSQCNGQVSQAEGCVLLDKTSNPNKYWNTADSYEASRLQNDILVAPIDAGNSNDANIIIKVTQDRVCGEWAYCDLKQEYEDEDSGEIKNRCYHLGVCQRAGAIDTAVGRVVKDCVEPVIEWDTKNKTLTAPVYRDFMTSWDSWDFAGYSVYDLRQVPEITARKIGKIYRMVYIDNDYSFLNTSTPFSCYPTGSIILKPYKEDGSPCGIGGNWGYCYNGECMRGYNNKNPASARLLTCRAYAEEMSPYPNTVLTDYTRGDPMQFKTGFQDVNLCYSNNGNPVSCDFEYYCSYRKLKTSGGEVFKRISDSEPVSTNYVCSSGPDKGMYCSGPESTQCGEEGICSKINSFQVLYGWPGYCLEYDARQRINGTTRNACLTWWPLEAPPGMPNYWEDDPKAGYQILEGRQDRYMCLENNPIIKDERTDCGTGGKHLGIHTGVESADVFNTSIYPENDSYFIDNQKIGGTDQSKTFTLHNLPENAAVAGCYNPGWSDFSNYYNEFDYEFYFKISENNSGAKFCPLTRDKIIFANGMYYCDYGENVACNSDNDLCHDSEAWLQYTEQKQLYDDGGNNNYIHRDEIERIDVFVDDTSAGPGKGFVSFINDMVDTEEGRRFYTNSTFVKNIGEETIYDRSLNDIGLPGWTVWSYAKGNGSNKWTEIQGKNSIVNSMNNNNYFSFNEDSSYSDQMIGIRIVFDDKNLFRGIWLNAENASGGDVGWGFFFVIHFNHGSCKYFAQVSTSSPDVDFSFKPFTNRLRTDSTTVTEDGNQASPSSPYDSWYVAARKEFLNGGHYGLAWRSDLGFANIPSSATSVITRLVNPFTYDFGPGFSQTGDANNNYGALGFSGGTPLVVWASQDQRNDSPGYLKVTSDNSITEADAPYRRMIQSMFAKVYDIWQQKYDDGKYAGYKLAEENSVAAGQAGDYAKNSSVIYGLYPPRVAAPDSTATGSWKLNAISVNGQTSGNIYLLTGSQARIKFYAWAHGNQMPIRRIVVEGGGGPNTQIDTDLRESIGNRKYVCANNICNNVGSASNWPFPCNSNDDCAPASEYGVGSCISENVDDTMRFGNTTDTGCKDKPWNFVMDYNCPYGTFEIVTKNSQPSTTISGKPIDWNYIRTNIYDASYVCVARPKVHVLDNWGWCTGDCQQWNSNLGETSGCYSEHDLGSQCLINNREEPWINYDGWVVVVPLVAN